MQQLSTVELVCTEPKDLAIPNIEAALAHLYNVRTCAICDHDLFMSQEYRDIPTQLEFEEELKDINDHIRRLEKEHTRKQTIHNMRTVVTAREEGGCEIVILAEWKK